MHSVLPLRTSFLTLSLTLRIKFSRPKQSMNNFALIGKACRPVGSSGMAYGVSQTSWPKEGSRAADKRMGSPFASLENPSGKLLGTSHRIRLGTSRTGEVFRHSHPPRSHSAEFGRTHVHRSHLRIEEKAKVERLRRGNFCHYPGRYSTIRRDKYSGSPAHGSGHSGGPRQQEPMEY